jgi:hypothetical protein
MALAGWGQNCDLPAINAVMVTPRPCFRGSHLFLPVFMDTKQGAVLSHFASVTLQHVEPE